MSSEEEDFEAELLQRNFYLSVGLACDDTKDCVRFIENDEELARLPKFFRDLNSSDKKNDEANVYYSHPKLY